MANTTYAEPAALEFAFGKVDDGNMWERFVLDFAPKIVGRTFVPAGGIHDRGIDGFEHAFEEESVERTIYQITIQKDYKSKAEDSLNKLRKNKITVKRFFYVTNQRIANKDALATDLFDSYGIPVYIWDLDWFKSHVNDSPQTIASYFTFVDSYLHEFSQPGRSYAIADFAGDPRLFVFLRQLWDDYRGDVPLTQLLADSLILFALEGTDPDTGILMSKQEIREKINEHVSLYPELESMVDQRLEALSRKPRRINHHRKPDRYVLPHATRLEVLERNLRDAALYEEFRGTTRAKVEAYLSSGDVSADQCVQLVEAVLHRIYSTQGLEFANFVLHGDAAKAVEKSLPDIVSDIVDVASIKGNPQRLKSSLLMTIRDVVYNGTPGQVEFLRRLSKTYVLLFLLRQEPKVAMYLSAMTAKLNIYVCTSVLIPALSEHFLSESNQRYSNLLRSAHEAGARLIVNDTIVDELAAHFRMIAKTFDDAYAGCEDAYAGEEEILYIPEIMIRAYFYAKMRGNVGNFGQFLENYVSRTLKHLKEDLIAWLNEDFGVDYVSDESLNVTVDNVELDKLYRELATHKSSPEKARTDAKLVLTIYALRKSGNEAGDAGAFGYSTWWLSTDTTTERAVRAVFGDRYETSVYMRADFLYNYITLVPSKAQADDAFRHFFPTLVGVSISYHMSKDVGDLVRSFVKEHGATNPARLRGAIRELADRLKSDPANANPKYVRLFLDEEKAKLSDIKVG